MIRVIATEKDSPFVLVEEDGKYFTVTVFSPEDKQPPEDEIRIYPVLGNNPEIAYKWSHSGYFAFDEEEPCGDELLENVTRVMATGKRADN